MKLFTRIIRVVTPLYYNILININILAILQGQKESMREKRAVNFQGEPLPWFTYPAIEYLKQFDFRKKTIFEFGSGNSSLFWATKAKSVMSIENKEEWYNYIKKRNQDNGKILLRKNKDSYVNSLIEQNTKYDIIIIDGMWRYACTKNVAKYLNSGGLIIFDNSEWYPNSTKLLRSQGFYQIDFNGFGPVNNYCWTTSIFFNAIDMDRFGFKNPEPIGGIKLVAEDDQE